MINGSNTRFNEWLCSLRGDAAAALMEALLECKGLNLESDAGRNMIVDKFKAKLIKVFND